MLAGIGPLQASFTELLAQGFEFLRSPGGGAEAMAEGGQERTEQATPKRLDEARKKGQVPRSVELSMAAVCIAAAAAIYTLGRGAAGKLRRAHARRAELRRRRTAVGENVIWPALMNAGSQRAADHPADSRRDVRRRAGRAARDRRLEFLGAGADAAVLAAESRERPRPHVLGARLGRARQGHRQGVRGRR